ncbi:MAG: hypothetical protein RL262_1767, partial [Bacteroidota bacterium]
MQHDNNYLCLWTRIIAVSLKRNGQKLAQIQHTIEMKKEEYLRLKKEHKRLVSDVQEDNAKLEDAQY